MTLPRPPRLARAVVANLGLQGGSVLMSFLATLLLGNLLGAEGMGQYAFAITMATVLSVFTRLGLESLLTREVAVAQTHARWGAMAGVVGWSWRASLAAALGVGAGVGGLAWAFARPSTAAPLMAAMALLVPMTGLVVPMATLRGLDRVVVANVPPLLVRPAVLLGGVVALTWAAWPDPTWAVGAHGLAYLLAWIAFIGPWHRHYPPEARASDAQRDDAAYLSAALPLVALAAVGLLTLHADLLMLKALGTDAQVGIYAIVEQLVRVIGLPLTVLNRVFAPRFAQAVAAEDSATLQRHAALAAGAITAMTLPVTAVLLLAGPWMLGWFGPEFPAGASALRILMVGQVFNALFGSVGTVMVMAGREREVGWIALGSAALNLGLNAWWIPRYGLEGAAMASATSLALFNAVTWWRARVALGVDSTVLGLWRRGSEPPAG